MATSKGKIPQKRETMIWSKQTFKTDAYIYLIGFLK